MREPKEIDHLRWFCEGCGALLHDATFLPPDGTVREVALALLAGWLAGVEAYLPHSLPADVPLTTTLSTAGSTARSTTGSTTRTPARGLDAPADAGAGPVGADA